MTQVLGKIWCWVEVLTWDETCLQGTPTVNKLLAQKSLSQALPKLFSLSLFSELRLPGSDSEAMGFNKFQQRLSLASQRLWIPEITCRYSEKSQVVACRINGLSASWWFWACHLSRNYYKINKIQFVRWKKKKRYSVKIKFSQRHKSPELRWLPAPWWYNTSGNIGWRLYERPSLCASRCWAAHSSRASSPCRQSLAWSCLGSPSSTDNGNTEREREIYIYICICCGVIIWAMFRGVLLVTNWATFVFLKRLFVTKHYKMGVSADLVFKKKGDAQFLMVTNWATLPILKWHKRGPASNH